MKNALRRLANYFLNGLIVVTSAAIGLYSLFIIFAEISMVDLICEGGNYSLIAADRYEMYQSDCYTRWFCYLSNTMQFLIIAICILIATFLVFKIKWMCLEDVAKLHLRKTLKRIRKMKVAERRKAEQKRRAKIARLKKQKQAEQKKVEESRKRMLDDHDIMGD